MAKPLLLLAFAALLSGCSADADGDAPGASMSMSSAEEARSVGAPGPQTSSHEGSWAAGIHAQGAPATTFLGPRPPTHGLDGTESGWLLELTWTASSPASETMGLDVYKDGATVATVAGGSPLRLPLPAPEAGEYTVNARATGPMDAAGAFAAQEFIIRSAVFAGIPFDSAYAFGA